VSASPLRAVVAFRPLPEQIETIVIGAGQAGLATSHFLTQFGCEHVILERGDVAHTWRTERWDGFYLNTPKFTQQLPGHEYRGPEPDAFSSLHETISYFDEYAKMLSAPVRTGVRVSGLRVETGGYRIEVEDDALHATNVVVATGAYQRPTPTDLTESVPADVLQLHANAYRRPEQLPDGAVLVVGSGQSGCQISDELLQAGRTVYLSCGRCHWAPRRYRGREIVHWLIESGFMDQTVDTLPSPAARLMCNVPISGNDGGHDCHPRWLSERGAILLGRLTDFDGYKAVFAPDLEASLTWGDDLLADILRKLDDYIVTNGIDSSEPEPREPPAPLPTIEELDLRDAGLSSVLWSNGFRPDFGWIDLPLFDADGWPVQVRGITSQPGPYFVGVHWLHKRKSSLLFGVGEDAEHVAAHIARGS
jgi:putative flavoprotein involved in K+ transport